MYVLLSEDKTSTDKYQILHLSFFFTPHETGLKLLTEWKILPVFRIIFLFMEHNFIITKEILM